LRQTDQNTACLLDFIGRQTRGRCLIPSSSLEYIFDEYKASSLNNHKIYLFKRDDDIFINFNFISKSNKRIGFYADEDGKPWFLFCRILTPGRIVLETGPNYTGGVIVTGKRDGVGFRNQSLPIEKKQRLLNKNDPFCPLVKVAENVISKGVRFININGSSSKCFCPTCYQQRNDSNHLFKGFVKFYITQINKNNAELKYQSLARDFLIPLRRQTHPKHDIRDRGKPLLTSFAEAKDLPFFLTRDRGTGVEYKVNIIGEFSTSSESEWPKLRNLYIKCSS